MRAIVLFLLAMLPLAASGQAVRTLQPVDDFRLPDEYARTMATHAECDSEGNVYFPVVAVAETFGSVLRPSHDGRSTTRYSLQGVPGLERYTMGAIATGRKGELYVLANNIVDLVQVARGTPPAAIEPELVLWLMASGNGSPTSVVATFDQAGKFRSRFIVDSPLVPFQIASFDSERFFLAGMLPIRGPEKPDYRPFAGIFDGQGRLVREVRLPPAPALEDSFNVRYAEAEPGADGNAYLVRRGEVGAIEVISPQGQVLRHLPLVPPPGLALSTVRAGSAGIATLSVRLAAAGAPGSFKTEAMMISILDPESGRVLEQYGRGSDLLTAGGFACYAGDMLTFIAHPEGQGIHLIHARAR